MGIKATADRELGDGRNLHRVTEVRFPTIRVIPTPTLTYTGKSNNMSRAVPIDNTHTKVYAMVRKPRNQAAQGLPVYAGTKTWFELTDEELQRFPGDYEAQVGQGRITSHSEEHLSSSDRGVSMVRRMWKQQLDVVDAGGDPLGVTFDIGPDTGSALFSLEAGNYLRDAATTGSVQACR